MLIKVAERIKINIKKHDIEFCKILINNVNVHNDKMSFTLDEIKQAYHYENIEHLKSALSRLVDCPVSCEIVGYDHFRMSPLLRGAAMDFKAERMYYAFSDLFLELLHKPQVANIFNKASSEQIELLAQHSKKPLLDDLLLHFTDTLEVMRT